MVNRRDAEQPIEFNEDETEQLPPQEEEEFEVGIYPRSTILHYELIRRLED